ncbi:hypothetical protein [Pengzhenrongella sicca]|uniref:Uncharacterized protein n=1 Tax=Pengzhenrongella sicca TaxID=2819238 RepID=A0A8A4ZE35_9MICO|nr:hypothetical protein [Pengzhenrongella sicca]QTE30232.1 hypothetical protein J4E96_04285 [Pengzhenrongella sicca]
MKNRRWIIVFVVVSLVTSGVLWLSFGAGGAAAPEASSSTGTASAAPAQTSAGVQPTVAAEGSSTPVLATPAQPAPAAPTATAGEELAPGGTAGTRASVEVVITYATWDDATAQAEISGYVTGVVEQSGTCSATFSQGSQTIEVRADALADATTTSCGGLIATGGTLSTGTWQISLAYDSAFSSGRSTTVSIEVP